MATDIVVPTLGESVTEATVAQWLKQPGDAVAVDEPVVELETDKVTLEVNASAAGVLSEVVAEAGANVEVGALLGRIGEGDGAAAKAPQKRAEERAEKPAEKQEEPAKPAAQEETPAATPESKPQPAAGANGEAMDITVPTLGESVTEATVAKWLKQPGESAEADEPLVELETDKVTLEVNAPAAGALQSIAAEEGATVEVGALLGVFAAGARGAAGAPEKTEAPAETEAAAEAPQAVKTTARAAPAEAGGARELDPAAARRTGGKITRSDLMAFLEQSALGDLGPAVRKLVEEKDLDPAVIPATGKDGRLTKEDVLNFLEGKAKPLETPSSAPAKAPSAPSQAKAPSAPAAPGAREERVRMTKLRQTIARRLKEAQNTAAMLTTFNECDMGAVMALRSRYKESFEKRHGVKLGFTSFFAKAVVAALQELPAVNARIDGDEIVYSYAYNIGMAVSTPNGLMVPVMRDCDKKSFAEIEKSLGELAAKGRDGKLSMDEMSGGTFTITNGGVFGSLMSTPILNMPQSGILGLHKIQERPMAVDGKVEIRPMMYLALSYDHRVIDGREAVTFLVRVKEAIEDPQRLLIGM